MTLGGLELRPRAAKFRSWKEIWRVVLDGLEEEFKGHLAVGNQEVWKESEGAAGAARFSKCVLWGNRERKCPPLEKPYSDP